MKNKANRVESKALISIIIFFVTFCIQIILGIIGITNFNAVCNMVIYMMSTAWIFKEFVYEKGNKGSITRSVIGTILITAILVALYLLILYIRSLII